MASTKNSSINPKSMTTSKQQAEAVPTKMPTPPMKINPTFEDMATGEHLTAIDASTTSNEEPPKPKIMRVKLTTNLNAAIPPQELMIKKVAANKITDSLIISTSRSPLKDKLIHTSPKSKLGLSSPPETSPEPEINWRKMEVPREHIAARLDGVLHKKSKEVVKFTAINSKAKQPVKRGASDNLASGKKKVACTSKKQPTKDRVKIVEVGNVAPVSRSRKQQPTKTPSTLRKQTSKVLTTENFSMMKRHFPWSRTTTAFKRNASPGATEYEEKHQQLLEFIEAQKVDGNTQNYTSSGWKCLNKPEFKSSGWVCLNEPATKQITVDLNDEANDQEQEDEEIQESYGMNGVTHINGLSIADVVKKARVQFEPFQEKVIARWMLEYGVRGTRSNPKAKAGYEILLQNLGFLNPMLSEHVMKALNTKVRLRLYSIWKAMLRDGAVLPEDQEKEFEDYSIKFADWAETWLEPSWNGTFVRPVYWISSEFKEAMSECSETNEREFMATKVVGEPNNITDEGGFMVTKAVFEAYEIIGDEKVIEHDRFIVSEDEVAAAENQSACIPNSTSEDVSDKPASLFPMADHNYKVTFAQHLGIEPPALPEINKYDEGDLEEHHDEDYDYEDDEYDEDAEYEEAEEVPEDTLGACYARVLDIKPSIIDEMISEKNLEVTAKEEQQVRLSCQPGCYAFALRGEEDH